MNKRHEEELRKYNERMARITAEIDAQQARTSTQDEPAAMRADMAALLHLLREVRYTQTVGEINTIRLTCDRIEQSWRIKPQRRIEVVQP